jgi:hypothetical protein
MLYYTQLIFIKDKQEETFNLFESKVLPLLNKYNGNLVYRIRPTKESVIETAIALPYELHLITFDTKQDFENYVNDEDRKKHLSLKESSIEKAILIEGKLI